MSTFTATITASSDDADQASSTVDITGGALNANATTQWSGFRFLNVTIPPGSTVTASTLELDFFSGSFDDPDLTIYAHDTDDAPTFTTTANDISARTPTTATVTWTASSIGTGIKTTPDLKTIIQEIIDRPGWTSGNDIAILYVGRSASSFARVRSLDAGTGAPAKLNITYTPGSGSSGQPPRTLHQFRQRRA